ncbi:MAG: 16S rRNA (guanine(966)-N(2))-methyltransferase RsmD [Clostridia bacterium]|nr:16S rRNA (guanine(966)-N(2))-methyltransferase RsmD [Clostridia bacterium]
MRIISGERRGHKLYEFSGDDIRPTTDRVKESLFNLIQDYIRDSRVFDMFCGSGALAFEALSRGARFAVCTDVDIRSINIIKKNSDALKYQEKCHIENISCFDYIKKTKEKFDLIFLDPPYNKDFIEKSLKEIVLNNLLNKGGIIVLESDNTDFHFEQEGLEILKQKKYGRTYITVYGIF